MITDTVRIDESESQPRAFLAPGSRHETTVPAGEVMKSVLRVTGIAFALTGWLLLAVFVVYEYLPSGVTHVAPGLVSVTWGAILAYVFGIRTYLRKREHELVRQRYVDGGIDRLRAFAEEAVTVATSNASKAASVLAGLHDDRSFLLRSEFRVFGLDPSAHLAMYRATRLLGDDVISSWIITMSSEVGSVSNLLARRFADPVSPLLGTLRSPEGGAAIPVLAKFFVDFASHLRQDTIPLLQGLEYVSGVIDKDASLGWSNIDRFRHRPEIRGAVKTLAEKLQRYEE